VNDDLLARALTEAPLIAILRGLPAADAADVVGALCAAGVRVAEVPLNSPDPFATIGLLAERFGDRMVVGGGTVVHVHDVDRLADAGARLCVSPNTDVEVIRAARRRGMAVMPGVATATEAFAAVAAGARWLKLFPAKGAHDLIAALRAVLPTSVALVPVGGVDAHNMEALRTAGAAAFGIGSELYRPGLEAFDVGGRARAMLAAARQGQPVRLLANANAAIGESPISLRDGIVVWTDPMRPALLRHAAGGSEVRVLPVDRPVWSLASRADGAVFGTTDDAFCTVDCGSGALVAGPTVDLPAGCRLNDMAIDPAGGLWAGVMHRGVLAARGAIIHAAEIGETGRIVAEGLGVPNGMAFSADGNTLFVIDTLARTLLAWPANVTAGSLGEPIIVTDFMGLPGKPDGMAARGDGSFWVAMWGGGCVVEILPDGATGRIVPVPAPHVSSLCVTGPDTLVISTSRMRLSAAQLASASGSGGLFEVDLE